MQWTHGVTISTHPTTIITIFNLTVMGCVETVNSIDNHLYRLEMVVVALCCTRHSGVPNINRCPLKI